MKKLLTIFFLFLLLFPLSAQEYPGYHIMHPEDIAAKNYYFTYLLSQTESVRKLVEEQPILQKMSTEKQTKLNEANTTYERLYALKFSKKEILQASAALASLYKKNNAFDKLLKEQILPSGCYGQYREQGAELIKKIWEQDANGLNYAIDVYGLGQKPNYPMIDSISFDINSKEYNNRIIPSVQNEVALWNEGSKLFCSLPMKGVDFLLSLNDRRQASDYEPLQQPSYNAPSYNMIASTQWEKYPYSAIFALGDGPKEKGVEISTGSRLRASIAAILYKQGKAPFIFVSGGKVHPYHTPFCEAIEMRKFLIQNFTIPFSNIIIEPHARHTTTNLRNIGRIMIREGFPINKPALVTSSDKSVIDYIMSEKFNKRFIKELGNVPYRLGKRISDNAVEFYPLPSALIINPLEPMDP